MLRPFAADKDRDIFAARTDDVRAAGDGSGAPAGDLDDEIRAAVGRVDAEEAAWLVAIDGSEKIGMVFGELAGGEVNVRIWIHPAYRKQGYGTAALRKSRSEMAAYFPAVPLVVRAPAAGPLTRRTRDFCVRSTFAPAATRTLSCRTFGLGAPPRLNRLSILTSAPMATWLSSASRVAGLLTVAAVVGGAQRVHPETQRTRTGRREVLRRAGHR